MRAYKRFDKRGFTLVELMIVVAIIGVLAALAIYGVRKYLASAKTSEAKNTVGAISRSAVGSYERETFANQLLGDGAVSATAMHVLCNTANRVPLTTPAGTKYQPSTAPLADFHNPLANANLDGWPCLRFDLTQPIYYSYGYERGVGSATAISGSTANGFEANAYGDLNGNGGGAVVPGPNIATFARGADLRNGEIVLSTTLGVQNEGE